jgi:hypothetical protein
MTHILNPLREELNKERASVRSYRIRVANGSDVSDAMHRKMYLSWDRIALLRSTIKKLKNVRPVYKWDWER